MKDIKSVLSEYTVPVEESEWQKISADARLVKYNRVRRIRRWATWGGCAAVGVAGIVVGSLLLSRPDKTAQTDEPKQPVAVEENFQTTPALTENSTVTVPALTEEPARSEQAMPTSYTSDFGGGLTTGEESAAAPSTSLPNVDNPVVTGHATNNNTLATTTTPTTPSAPTVSERKTVRLTEEPIRVSKPETASEPETMTPKSQSESLEEAASAYQLFVPNSFTPDGNGNNDLFMPKAGFAVQDYEINIFSRNGARVFTSRNIEQGWDGYNHGTLLPTGAYMYVIRYTDPDGNAKTLKGQVVLLK